MPRRYPTSSSNDGLRGGPRIRDSLRASESFGAQGSEVLWGPERDSSRVAASRAVGWRPADHAGEASGSHGRTVTARRTKQSARNRVRDQGHDPELPPE